MMKKVIANALHEAQEEMPVGQNWNLHSKSACEELAHKIQRALEEAGMSVTVSQDFLSKSIEKINYEN